MIKFVTASHNNEILNDNLLKSRIINKYPLEIMRGYNNVSKAYNSCLRKEEIMIYVHHDVFLPNDFESMLFKSLNDVPDDWGVLGVAGVKLVNGRKEIHGHILDRGHVWGKSNGLPAEVQTLDELLLITRGDIVFDENLPLHFYGADICMQVIANGKKVYAIGAFCHHNSGLPFGERTEEFYQCQDYFRNKWKNYLPIVTTCSFMDKAV